MADRNDERSEQPGTDSDEDLRRAIELGAQPELIRDLDEDLALDGSRTWETLDQEEAHRTQDEERRGDR